jgi:hypothetical protein
MEFEYLFTVIIINYLLQEISSLLSRTKKFCKASLSCVIDVKLALYNNSVYHDSVLVKKVQENILEFLLINHPLDCPICDQGGDCGSTINLYFLD